MFDLKDTAVFMYKAAKHRYIFTWDGFGEVNVIKIVNEKILFNKDFVYKCNASLHVIHYRCYKLFIVK